MNEDCKSSEKNNINFTVQSLVCMISIHNILTSYVDDSRFQNNQKNSFIMINNYVKNENISFTISLYVIICQ